MKHKTTLEEYSKVINIIGICLVIIAIILSLLADNEINFIGKFSDCIAACSIDNCKCEKIFYPNRFYIIYKLIMNVNLFFSILINFYIIFKELIKKHKFKIFNVIYIFIVILSLMLRLYK